MYKEDLGTYGKDLEILECRKGGRKDAELGVHINGQEEERRQISHLRWKGCDVVEAHLATYIPSKSEESMAENEVDVAH